MAGNGIHLGRTTSLPRRAWGSGEANLHAQRPCRIAHAGLSSQGNARGRLSPVYIESGGGARRCAQSRVTELRRLPLYALRAAALRHRSDCSVSEWWTRSGKSSCPMWMLLSSALATGTHWTLPPRSARRCGVAVASKITSAYWVLRLEACEWRNFS